MRETATFIQCDGDGCSTMAKVVDKSETPDGWYRIAEAKAGKLDLNNAFDLCSLRCIEKWAKARRRHMAEIGNGNGARTRTLILEAMEDGEPVAVSDLATLIERTPTGIMANLKAMAEEGTIEIVRQPVRGNSQAPGLYRLTKVHA